MSSSSRLVLIGPVIVFADVRSLGMRGSLRRVGIRGGQVGELVRGAPRGLVDAVADDGSVPRVHEHGEDRVHNVVVERPAAAGPVTFAAPGGKLDLQERALLCV